MKELNEMLEQYIPVPRSMSLPRIKYQSHLPEDLDSEEDLDLAMAKLSADPGYEYDISDYEKYKTHLEEFLFYRKKFE
jgi:hypothetical protein